MCTGVVVCSFHFFIKWELLNENLLDTWIWGRIQFACVYVFIYDYYVLDYIEAIIYIVFTHGKIRNSSDSCIRMRNSLGKHGTKTFQSLCWLNIIFNNDREMNEVRQNVCEKWVSIGFSVKFSISFILTFGDTHSMRSCNKIINTMRRTHTQSVWMEMEWMSFEKAHLYRQFNSHSNLFIIVYHHHSNPWMHEI